MSCPGNGAGYECPAAFTSPSCLQASIAVAFPTEWWDAPYLDTRVSLSYGSASPYEVMDGGAGIPSAALVYDLSSPGRGDSFFCLRSAITYRRALIARPPVPAHRVSHEIDQLFHLDTPRKSRTSPPVLGGGQGRARYVPDRESHRGQPRSLTGKVPAHSQVSQPAGGSRAAP